MIEFNLKAHKERFPEKTDLFQSAETLFKRLNVALFHEKLVQDNTNSATLLRKIKFNVSVLRQQYHSTVAEILRLE